MIHDYREFDRAVGLAYEFYRKYPRETLILVTSDHETGGLGFTMALKDLASTKVRISVGDERRFEKNSIDRHLAAKSLANARAQPTPESIDKLMREHFTGFTLAPEFKEAIIKRQPDLPRDIFDPTANALGMMIANNTQAYWQTRRTPTSRYSSPLWAPAPSDLRAITTTPTSVGN